MFYESKEEEARLDAKCAEVREHCARRIRGAIRKHLPELAMLHSEVEKAVFPLPREVLKLEAYRRDHLDRARLNDILGRIEARNRKRKREEEEKERETRERQRCNNVERWSRDHYLDYAWRDVDLDIYSYDVPDDAYYC